MNNSFRSLLLSVPVAIYYLSSCVGTSAAEAPSEKGLSRYLQGEYLSTLTALIKPSDNDLLWLSGVAWETDLGTARKKAGELGRPIFLWEMDGHPLGCT